ncbi:MAG: YggT family protein [Candidatus Melainabacteria bacterium]|nr:YggT family protein [Candidatus Melainabacteria bacterium]
MGQIASLVYQAIDIYAYMLLAWVICSWFPQVQSTKFYDFLDRVVGPYAKIFRGFIPPLGGFDFSVIIAFIALQFLQRIVASLLMPAL